MPSNRPPDPRSGADASQPVRASVSECSDNGKPSKACGAQRLSAAADELKRACDEAFPGKDNKLCKQEADQIVNAMVKTWNYNHGKGTNTSGDNIGGYLCWDWAKAFSESAQGLNPKYWSVEEKMVEKNESNVVHFYVELKPRGAPGQAGVRYIDDGWFDGQPVHKAPWPPSSGWTPGNWKPGPSQYVQPPIVSSPPDP